MLICFYIFNDSLTIVWGQYIFPITQKWLNLTLEALSHKDIKINSVQRVIPDYVRPLFVHDPDLQRKFDPQAVLNRQRNLIQPWPKIISWIWIHQQMNSLINVQFLWPPHRQINRNIQFETFSLWSKYPYNCIYLLHLQSYFSNSIYCVMILPRTSSIYKNYEDGISRGESMFSAYRMGPVASRCGLWNIDSLEKSMKISNKLFDIFMDFSRPSIFHYGSPSYESSVSLHRSRTPWMTS